MVAGFDAAMRPMGLWSTNTTLSNASRLDGQKAADAHESRGPTCAGSTVETRRRELPTRRRTGEHAQNLDVDVLQVVAPRTNEPEASAARRTRCPEASSKGRAP